MVLPDKNSSPKKRYKIIKRNYRCNKCLSSLNNLLNNNILNTNIKADRKKIWNQKNHLRCRSAKNTPTQSKKEILEEETELHKYLKEKLY